MGEPLTWLLIVQVHFRLSYVEFMDVVRIFSKGGSPGNFPKIFLGGTKIGEICFFPLETKKTTLFSYIFKIQEALPPTDAHGGVHSDNEIYAPIQQTL